MQVKFHAAVTSESLKRRRLSPCLPAIMLAVLWRGIFFGVEWNTFRFEKVCVGCGESLGFQMLLPAILMLSHCKAYHSPINGRTLLSTAHLEVKVGDGICDFILREWSTCE